jgi:hypothetical protein
MAVQPRPARDDERSDDDLLAHRVLAQRQPCRYNAEKHRAGNDQEQRL